MCDFLGKAKGTEVSRASVTRAIVAYAKQHNLMKKQQITTDATLRKLLALNESDSLTILNLQTYLSKHYPKAAAAAAPATA
jgi:chromatin remodeling complex protein RSC6